ncbi:hypothetical protein AGR4B_Lc70156 [Agrobacterium tumefaciens str. CFBP 5621]|uniref:hypothetical protein n=1 Tax=Agrobacterium tumefaciens TaxID=358 RepID=UPI0009BBFE95|nr:hypothetical protein [Agrobacterium tumefaciens]CUX50689.1 hypothetical protein AGR4B_Lc70156 [Agrobacterium tumefaciens str. CFBP 5621]
MLKLDCPRDKDTHTVADFAEILCWVTSDRYCSRDYLSDYIQDYSSSKLTDNELDDVFLQLSWRASAFGNAYPFSFVQKDKVLHGVDQTTDLQNLYIFLLFCANLPFLSDRKYSKGLTDAFEQLSMITMKELWPPQATVKAFGKNATEYPGKKWERLNKLSKDIGGEANNSAADFRKNDSGDGGIDLVAWLSLDIHEHCNVPTALAQCACSRQEWVTKQLEISNARLNRTLRPTNPWMELIFIPHSFRDSNGAWAVKSAIGLLIVMDRLRIINRVEKGVSGEFTLPAEFYSLLGTKLDLV